MYSKFERTVKYKFRKTIQSVKLQFVYKTTKKMCNLFCFKDKILEDLQSDLIYLFTCGTCNGSRYVGLTQRHYKVRICEHSGTSPRTGKCLAGQCSTSVRDHMLVCPHKVTYDDFKILSSGGSSNVLAFKETLLINKLKPDINKTMTSTELFLFT